MPGYQEPWIPIKQHRICIDRLIPNLFHFITSIDQLPGLKLHTVNIHERIQISPGFLGFRKGDSGAHTSRSMMLNEIRDLFVHTSPNSTKDDYIHAIIQLNVLNKPTESSIIKSNRIIIDLYGLDPDLSLFRILRQLYEHSPDEYVKIA